MAPTSGRALARGALLGCLLAVMTALAGAPQSAPHRAVAPGSTLVERSPGLGIDVQELVLDNGFRILLVEAGEQVRAAAERYIQPERLSTVIIGPIEAVRNARHPRWPAALVEPTEHPITGSR